MVTKRLFLAIPLGESMKDALLSSLNYVDNRDIRPVSEENLHITVCFMGDVDITNIPPIKAVLKEIVGSMPAFELKFKDMVFAPPGVPPRMVWAEFIPDIAYADLSKKVYMTVKAYLNPENAKDDQKDPIPHITMLRFNDPAVAKSVSFRKVGQSVAPVELCHLFESKLTPRGPIYTSLETFYFKSDGK